MPAQRDTHEPPILTQKSLTSLRGLQVGPCVLHNRYHQREVPMVPPLHGTSGRSCGSPYLQCLRSRNAPLRMVHYAGSHPPALAGPRCCGFCSLLKGKLTPLARRLEPDRALWQRSFYDHALRREETLSDVARYIWHNPVRAGLVMRARDYPWSGSLVWSDWKAMLEGGSGECGRG